MTIYQQPGSRRRVVWGLLLATVLVAVFGLSSQSGVLSSPAFTAAEQLEMNQKSSMIVFAGFLYSSAARLVAPLILLYTIAEITPPLRVPYVQKFSREHYFAIIQGTALKTAVLFSFILILTATIMTIVFQLGMLTFNNFLGAARWLILSYFVILLNYGFSIQIWVLLIYLLRSKGRATTGVILLIVALGLLDKFTPVSWFQFVQVDLKLYAFLCQAYAEFSYFVFPQLLNPVLRQSVILLAVTVGLAILNFFISKRRDLL